MTSSMTYKRLLYYELTIQNPVKGQSPLPIAIMISSDHSLPTIINFFNQLRYIEGKICGGRSNLCVPKQINSDRAWVFILASLIVFNKEDYRDYLDRCFRIVTGGGSKADLGKTVIHACTAHIMKDIKKICQDHYQHRRKAGMYMFSLLLNAWTWEEFMKILKNIVVVTMSPKRTTLVQNAYDDLENRIKGLNKTKSEAVKELEAEINEFDRDEIKDELVMFSEEENLTKAKSNFSLYFDNFIKHSLKEIDSTQAESGDDNNFYEPIFWRKIKTNFLPSTPLWSMMMLGDLTRHNQSGIIPAPDVSHLDRTNGIAEHRMFVLKNIQLLYRKKLRPDELIAVAKTDILGMERQYLDIYFKGIKIPSLPVKETWAKKGKARCTKLSYQQAPKESFNFSRQSNAIDKQTNHNKSPILINSVMVIPMENFNNNCWFNSVNQLIITTPQLHEFFSALPVPDDVLPSDNNTNARFARKIHALYKTVHTTKPNKQNKFLSEKQIKPSLLATQESLNARQNEEMDAQEYLTMLIHSYLTPIGVDTHIDITETHKCNSCGKTKTRKESVNTLRLTLPESTDETIFLPNLISNYTSQITRHSDNSTVCNCNSTISESTCITSLPSLMLINIARLSFNFNTIKVMTVVEIPKQIEINSVPYSLHGVVNHHGDHADNGHYSCTVFSETTAVLANDEVVRSIPLDDNLGETYIIAYCKQTQPQTFISLEDFGRLMSMVNRCKGGQKVHSLNVCKKTSELWKSPEEFYKLIKNHPVDCDPKVHHVVKEIVSRTVHIFSVVYARFSVCTECNRPAVWNHVTKTIVEAENLTSSALSHALIIPSVTSHEVQRCNYRGCEKVSNLSEPPHTILFPQTIIVTSSSPAVHEAITIPQNSILGRSVHVKYNLSFLVLQNNSHTLTFYGKNENSWYSLNSTTSYSPLTFGNIAEECRKCPYVLAFFDKEEQASDTLNRLYRHITESQIHLPPVTDKITATCLLSSKMRDVIKNHKGDINIGPQKLSEDSFHLLLTNSRCNDEIINTYVSLLFENNPEFCFLDTYATYPLNRSVEEMMVPVIRKSARREAIYNKEYIIMPVHCPTMEHWILLFVSIRKHHIHLFDSLGMPIHTYDKELDHVTKYLYALHAAVYPQNASTHKMWTVHFPLLQREFPQQKDEINCGVYVAIYAKCLAIQSTLNFPNTPSFIYDFRYCMAYELITQTILSCTNETLPSYPNPPNSPTLASPSTSTAHYSRNENKQERAPRVIDNAEQHSSNSASKLIIETSQNLQGDRNETSSLENACEEIPSLPIEIWEKIIVEMLRQDYSQLHIINRVCSTFMYLARRHLKIIGHITEGIGDRLLNRGRASIRALTSSTEIEIQFGNIKRLIGKHPRFEDAWVILSELENYHRGTKYYVLADIYWK